MSLNFYNVNKDYVSFLQSAELQKRGFTRVPNMDYGGQKQKFLCGIILTAPKTHLKYFVGVTHYAIQRSENFLIRVESDRKPVKGSLRFNFMFPVPLQSVTKIIINNEPDIQYRALLSKELKAVNENAGVIIDKANQVYSKVTNRRCSENLLINSCDFTYLEEKCLEYCKIHGIDMPTNIVQPVRENVIETEHTPFNDLLVERAKKEKQQDKAKGMDKAHERDNDPER